MNNFTRTIFLSLALLVAGTGSSFGGDFVKGSTAYQSGDFATALQEWIPLAQQGDANAQFYVGWMYYNGEGVPKDAKTGGKWITLAAEQGDATYQSFLGEMYIRGQGVLKDDKTAMKWFTLAAEQGDADAQYALGVIYRFGEGVLQDYVYAHMWGNIAASNGSGNGGEFRDNVAKQMTSAQIAKAQELARECVRKEYKGC